jgi:gluconate kinase
LGLNLRICYLKGAFDEIKSRLENRHGNFARETILAGQFADFEEPGDSVVHRASETPEDNDREALRALRFV